MSELRGDLQTAAITQDGLVDVMDFAILASRWGTVVNDCASGDPHECALGADVTGDALQNRADFDLMQVYFFLVGDPQNACKPTGGAEPGTSGRLHTRMRVTDLAVRLPLAQRADATGDGLIDARDIRAFAQSHHLILRPEFEGRLQRLESAAVQRQDGGWGIPVSESDGGNR